MPISIEAFKQKMGFGRQGYEPIENTVGENRLGDPIPTGLTTSTRKKLNHLRAEYAGIEEDDLFARHAKLEDIIETATAWLEKHPSSDTDGLTSGPSVAVEHLNSLADIELTSVRDEMQSMDIVIPKKNDLRGLPLEFVTTGLIRTNRTERINKLLATYNELRPAQIERRQKTLSKVVTTATEWLMDVRHDQTNTGKRKRMAIKNVLDITLAELTSVSNSQMRMDTSERQMVEGAVGTPLTQEAVGGLTNMMAASSAHPGKFQEFIAALKKTQEIDTNYHAQMASAWSSGAETAAAVTNLEPVTAYDSVMKLIDSPLVAKALGALGILSAAAALKTAWDDRKALKEAVKRSTSALHDAAVYGLAKVSRRFYMVLKSFIFALVKAVMHVVTLATGGFAAAFTEAAAMALTLTDATINVGLALKGAYKAFAQTRGVNREKHSKIIVEAAIAEARRIQTSREAAQPGPALTLIQTLGFNTARVTAAMDSPKVRRKLIQEVMPHLKSR